MSEERSEGSLLECSGLVRSFVMRHRVVRVLCGVDLAVGRGEVVLISGRSGAGKSTLLGLLGGMDRPTAGIITFEGRRLDRLSAGELAELRRTRIGIIFQNFNLLPSWTALENVEAGLARHGRLRAERRRQAAAMLDELGIGDRLRNLPLELSAGEQQRVALARALANRPSLVLADEPTADVDTDVAREIVRRLVGAARQGAAVVVATHGIFPADTADRVLVMHEGRLHPQ